MIEIDEAVLEEARVLLRASESLCNVLPAPKRAGYLAFRCAALRERIERELAGAAPATTLGKVQAGAIRPYLIGARQAATAMDLALKEQAKADREMGTR